MSYMQFFVICPVHFFFWKKKLPQENENHIPRRAKKRAGRREASGLFQKILGLLVRTAAPYILDAMRVSGIQRGFSQLLFAKGV